MQDRDFSSDALLHYYYICTICVCMIVLLQEAYRRWVCSTLVPYFAEPKDVKSADEAATKSAAAKAKAKAAAAASTAAASVAGKSKRSARSTAAGGIRSGHKSLKLISNNNKSNNGNNMNERQINQEHDKSSNANSNSNANKDNDHSDEEAIGTDLAQTFYDVVGLSKLPGVEDEGDGEDADEPQPDVGAESDSDSESASEIEMEGETDTDTDTDTDTEAVAKQQSNNFISTANNSDPRATDPVISKLQKR